MSICPYNNSDSSSSRVSKTKTANAVSPPPPFQNAKAASTSAHKAIPLMKLQASQQESHSGSSCSSSS